LAPNGVQTRLPTGLLDVKNDNYPIESLIANEEGRTVLTIAVAAADGRVADAKVDASSGHPRLDQAALRYAMLTSFWPSPRDNPSNMDSLQISVTWKLPLRALNDVNAENARGGTVTASDAGGEMPTPLTSRVMTFGDYPYESIRDNEHGTVDLRYLIQTMATSELPR